MTESVDSMLAERARQVAETITATERSAREVQAHLAELRQVVTRARAERAELVAEMRGANLTWDAIGEALGITRQAAIHIGKTADNS